MRYRSIRSLKVSAIGLGTWQFGSRTWGYGSQYAEVDAFRIVDAAREAGINFFDTAELYGFGKSESILGRAVAQVRDEVVLATKLFPLFPAKGVGPAHAERSLARLGTSSIDLYQIHFPNPIANLAHQVAEFAPLCQNGSIRELGVSNFSLSAWRQTEATSGMTLVSNQVEFSLLSPKPLREMIPWATSHDRLVIAYSPLAQGILTGKYDHNHRPGGFRRILPGFSARGLLKTKPLVNALVRISKGYGATASQIALAWVISFPSVVAIPGASSVEQVRLNAQAADIELSLDEREELGSLAGSH